MCGELNYQSYLNIGTQTLHFGGDIFHVYSNSTVEDVLDTIRDWAEQSVYFRKRKNYYSLGKYFNIPLHEIAKIEAESIALFSPIASRQSS
ncbi:hypothetical protein CN918_25370 [Priestia megaterium]|nr:hypothetical protein CN918_25370 [Priestia megaterium]